MKIICIFVITLIVFSFPLSVEASRGCCSWHGGISHCGENGYYICNDGTQSPSCTCSYQNNNNSNNITYNCSGYIDEISELENENDKLKEINERLEKDDKFNTIAIWVIIIIFAIYYVKTKKR